MGQLILELKPEKLLNLQVAEGNTEWRKLM